jgi:hypothetical protein
MKLAGTRFLSDLLHDHRVSQHYHQADLAQDLLALREPPSR